MTLDEQTIEVEQADVASAYEKAITLCGWPKLSASRVKLSTALRLVRGQKNTWGIGGLPGWTVTLDRDIVGCELPSPVGLVLRYHADGDMPRGADAAVEIAKSDAKNWVTLQPDREFSPWVRRLETVVSNAGDDGWFRFQGSPLQISLFGFAEALHFACESCVDQKHFSAAVRATTN